MKIQALNDDELEQALQDPEPARRSSSPLDEEWNIPAEAQIIELLDLGWDSYRICDKLGCNYLDVVNAERRRKGVKKLLKENPTEIIDTEVTDPIERATMFPPLEG